jgi:hypothetical protein
MSGPADCGKKLKLLSQGCRRLNLPSGGSPSGSRWTTQVENAAVSRPNIKPCRRYPIEIALVFSSRPCRFVREIRCGRFWTRFRCPLLDEGTVATNGDAISVSADLPTRLWWRLLKSAVADAGVSALLWRQQTRLECHWTRDGLWADQYAVRPASSRQPSHPHFGFHRQPWLQQIFGVKALDFGTVEIDANGYSRHGLHVVHDCAFQWHRAERGAGAPTQIRHVPFPCAPIGSHRDFDRLARPQMDKLGLLEIGGYPDVVE